MRALTEWTSTNPTNTMDQTSISEGIGGYILGADSSGFFGDVNVRQRFIQGLNTSVPASAANFTGGVGFGNAPQTTDLPSGAPAVALLGTQFAATRRYQINFALGLFTQDKLVSFIYFTNFQNRFLPNLWHRNSLLKLLWSRPRLVFMHHIKAHL